MARSLACLFVCLSFLALFFPSPSGDQDGAQRAVRVSGPRPGPQAHGRQLAHGTLVRPQRRLRGITHHTTLRTFLPLPTNSNTIDTILSLHLSLSTFSPRNTFHFKILFPSIVSRFRRWTEGVGRCGQAARNET
jgi:hypothetical protein